MSETLPKTEPSGFSAGDSVRWLRRVEVYGDHKDPADSWVLTYRLINNDEKIEIACSDNGDGYFLASVTATDSADYAVGVYVWRAFVAKNTDRFVVGEGRVCLEPDYAALGSYDSRSWAEQMLEALEAMLLKSASKDQQSYSIGGRSLSRFSRAELFDARDRVKREISNEDASRALAQGGPHRGIVRVRV